MESFPNLVMFLTNANNSIYFIPQQSSWTTISLTIEVYKV